MHDRTERKICGWTRSEMARRLAVSTSVFQSERLGARELARIRAAGIERIELSTICRWFDVHEPAQVAEFARAMRGEGLAVVAVHGPFDLPYRSADPDAQATVIDESAHVARIAAELGASVYVGHFGCDDMARQTIEALLDRLAGLKIVLTTENRVGEPLDEYCRIVDGFDTPRFRFTLDVGHARDADGVNPFTRPARARKAVTACRGRLGHVHLHDSFDQPARPDHRAPLHPDGILCWDGVFGGLAAIGYGGHLVFEDGRGECPDEWIAMTVTFPERFVARYAR